MQAMDGVLQTAIHIYRRRSSDIAPEPLTTIAAARAMAKR
jgi:hypothetical protein